MFSAFVYVLAWYKTQEMSHETFSEDPFLLVYCLDKYKTQKNVWWSCW